MNNDTLDSMSTDCLPKVCGADYEFQNFISGLARPEGTGFEASRLLLRQIDGYAGDTVYAGSSDTSFNSAADTTLARRARGEDDDSPRPKATYYSQDWGRRFLTNGSCFYVDLNHLEGCIPEVLSARDHVAACHALFYHAHQASVRANERLREGHKVVLVANNSDGQGNSFGTHLSFLVTRRAWDNLFHRKLHHQLILAAFQASLQVITGQGKVGAENDQPAAPYQISQRADFFETLCAVQTTFNRPIINSRDETLCGEWRPASLQDPATRDMARLHCIFFDNNLCHVASFLKVGAMQILLTMLEAASHLDANLILDDAVSAVVAWSHDPSLRATARLVSGEDTTAVALQRRFHESAARFVAAGGCEGFVPHADEIIELWGDTLHKLERRDFAALAARLDWVLKKTILEEAMRRKAGLNWSSPEIKYLDHQYANLDPQAGLYWAYERAGVTQCLVTEGHISRFVNCPPDDTRAWTRAALLTLASPEDVDCVDWDYVRFRFRDDTHWLPSYRTVRLGNPLKHTKAHARRLMPESGRLQDVLEAFGADDGAPASSSYSNAYDSTQNELPVTSHSVSSATQPNPLAGEEADSKPGPSRPQRKKG